MYNVTWTLHENGAGATPTFGRRRRRRQRADQLWSAAAAASAKCRRRRRGGGGAQLYSVTVCIMAVLSHLVFLRQRWQEEETRRPHSLIFAWYVSVCLCIGWSLTYYWSHSAEDNWCERIALKRNCPNWRWADGFFARRDYTHSLLRRCRRRRDVQTNE